jgi:hypothetical protein
MPVVNTCSRKSNLLSLAILLTTSSGDLDSKSNLAKPTLDWNQDAAPYITDTISDVLVILDCCYASSTAVDNSTGPEVLAASTWHTTAGAALHTSFTQNLLDELKRLNGNSASVASIYAQIHRSTKPYTDIATCPLHLAKIGRDSIILSKLWPPTIKNQTIIGPLQPNDERVVISVHLSDHNGVTPDLGQWTAWLASNLPSHISKTQITIEGVFDTDSIVILVSMPLEVWTMLPDADGAYGFVSFVKSSNRLLPRLAALPMRDTKENLPMTSSKGQRDPGGSRGFGGSFPGYDGH